MEIQGKWEEAEKLYDQADDMKRPEYSEAYKKYLEQRDILYAKAKALVSQGKWAEAEKLYDQAEDLDRPVVEASSLTQGLKSKRSVLRQINPHLYDEINKTMRYAALFRYVKLNYPSSWKIFYAQLANKEPEPAVVTPYSFTARRN
jgi:tetratricopeptide (TPR) repeat protein